MVVDSDTQHLSYLSQLLQRFEYQIQTAESAQEALQVTAAMVPSLIITALDLRDMDGLDLLRVLKKDPRTAYLPCIALRRQEDFCAEDDCRSLGTVSCLCKPVQVEMLYRTMQSAFEKTPRSAIRIRTTLPVKVDTTPFDGHGGTHSLDLSERGLFLHTLKPAPVDTQLALRINLNGLIIAAESKVIYSGMLSRGLHHEAGMGLEFIRIAPRDQELIQKYIRDDVTRGITPMN